MTVRLKRLTHPRRLVAEPAWGTNHVIGNVIIEKEDARSGDRRRPLALPHDGVPQRDDVRHFAGSYVHHLKKTKDGYRIKLQRVDMVNGGGLTTTCCRCGFDPSSVMTGQKGRPS